MYIYYLRYFEIALAIVAVIISIIFIAVSRKKGTITKKGIVSSVLLFIFGTTLLCTLFGAFDYSKTNINEGTINRLLTLPVEKIDMSKFNGSTTYSDETVYMLDIENSKVNGMVRISSTNENEISYDHFSFIRKILTKEYRDKDTYVLVEARENDRNFEQFPLITNYLNAVSIIQDGYLIEITYWQIKNDSSTINLILDDIMLD